MHLFLKSFDTITHNVVEGQTVADLKVFLANKDNLPLADTKLYLGSVLLEDDYNLNNIADASTVDVVVPLFGGKVHGSLARAGKVRGQTPKVEKQEKKKKMTGRAKRRLQYNRRFVAVVATMGARRRGPNAQTPA